MRNRAVAHREDFSCTLRPARTYRALVVVCGETSVEEIEDTLVEAGFERGSLLLAPPNDWEKVAPRDWPDEPELEGLSANECLVRIMGELHAATPVTFRRDVRLPSEATFTIAQAWEYAPPLEQSGGAPPAPAPARDDRPRGFGLGSLVAVGAATLACGWYFSQRSARRQEREREAMISMLEHDDQEQERAELERLEVARIEARAEDEDMRPGLEGIRDATRELAAQRLRFERALARQPPERRREVLALLEEGT